MRDCNALIESLGYSDRNHRAMLKQREYALMIKNSFHNENFRREPFHVTYTKRMKEKEKERKELEESEN